MADWIEEFLNLTEPLSGRTPFQFRLWSAIGTIAAILERRVWTETEVKPLFPNMYIILGGTPGSGKSIMIGEVREMLTGIRGLYLGPDNPTEASFKDALNDSAKQASNGSGLLIHSAMTVLCREFGVLIPKYSEGFLADMSDLWDSPPKYTAPRRTTKSLEIEHPVINILAAATPEALGRFPEAAWNEGFCSRTIIVYGSAPTTANRNIFKKREKPKLDRLKKQLEIFYNEIHGEFIWEDSAQQAFSHWYNDEQMAPVPDYGRLRYYNVRRDSQTMKLAMISAISAGNGLSVTKSDFERARTWLLETEKLMPDIFRAMGGKSDTQLLQDAHRFFWVKYSSRDRDKRLPIDEKEFYQFFEEKTTSDRISGLIQMMEKTGRIRKKVGLTNSWIPNPLDTSSKEITQ